MKSIWLAKYGWSRLLVFCAVSWLVCWYLLHADEIGLWWRWLLATPTSSCRDMLPPTSAYLSACIDDTQSSGTFVDALLRRDPGNFDRYMASRPASVIWL